MKAKLKKTEAGMALELEEKFCLDWALEEGAVEVTPVRRGMLLLEQKKEEGAVIKVSPEELAVLKRLDGFKFEERMPFKVNKELTNQERTVLAGLLEKKMVRVYKGGKYAKTGVYNIDDLVYPFLHAPAAGAAGSPKQVAKPALNTLGHLRAYGYMVVENAKEANDLSQKLESEIKAGQVLGVRGFDRKFYVASKAFYEKYEKQIQLSLGKGGKTAAQLATELNLAEDACHALLLLLSEAGEVIEKKKGIFALV